MANEEAETNMGNKISFEWSKIKGKNWMIFTDNEGKELMRIDKDTWDYFAPKHRDEIYTKLMNYHG